MVFSISNEYNRGIILAVCFITIEYANWLSYMGKGSHSKWKLIFAILCEGLAAVFYFMSEWKTLDAKRVAEERSRKPSVRTQGDSGYDIKESPQNSNGL